MGALSKGRTFVVALALVLAACGEAHSGSESAVARPPPPAARDAGRSEPIGFAGADSNQPALVPQAEKCDAKDAIDPSTASAEWVRMGNSNDIRFTVLAPTPIVPGNYQVLVVSTHAMHWFDISAAERPFTLLLAASEWPPSSLVRLQFTCYGSDITHYDVAFLLDTSTPSDSGPIAVTPGPDEEDAGIRSEF